WPLPSMALLAHTLALLAMAVATVAITVLPLNTALDSFDDQYRGCGPAMTELLPALNCSEFQQNPLFARVWAKAAAEWWRRGPPVTPLSPAQATAIMAFTMDGLDSVFNAAVRVAGCSHWEYRDTFHFKMLHFLLTQALGTLRDALPGQCRDMFQQVCGVRIEAQFAQFMPTLLSKPMAQCLGEQTVFQVHTCHSADIAYCSEHLPEYEVWTPPFETFEVTEVTGEGDKAQIQLCSSGTFSKYNCEWLQGDSRGDSLG
ncbi:NRT2 ribosyltransferase, partial [Irena cyanogastra]|nr:NRT2 ribosyltransferase [Irena cyanogastra]